MRTRTIASILFVSAACILLLAAPALAYDEPNDLAEEHYGSTLENCVPCHRTGPSGTICTMCHSPHPSTPLDEVAGKGPHGLYDSTTDRCDACHVAHEAGGAKLLPAATITASCHTCHDGTGGRGVYGTIFARTGVAPEGLHSIDTTNVVPGGDADTGGSAQMAFGGADGNLGCGDCHSAHDSSTVTSFTAERWRTNYPLNVQRAIKTTRLLRSNPGDATETVSEYGSDWCIACHQGRSSGGAIHNHPVDSTASTDTPFYYDNVAALASDDATTATVLGTLAGTNRGYIIPYPRTSQQGAHLPICQQCHEDSRDVGTLTDDTGDAEAFTITTADGVTSSDNPRFQNFPHETVNDRFLVETDDDLCLNCHPVSQLP